MMDPAIFVSGLALCVLSMKLEMIWLGASFSNTAMDVNAAFQIFPHRLLIT